MARTRQGMFTAGVAALALLAAGCGNDEAPGGSGDDPYRIYITGGVSSQGMAAQANTSILAAKAGVEVVNEAGGIDGRQVELVVTDDAGDPTQAVTNLRKALASAAKPDAYLNSGPSTITTAILPVLNQNDILSFNIAPTEESADPSTFPLNFNLAPTLKTQGDGIAAYLAEQGYASAGIIHGSSASGEQVATAMEESLKGKNIEVVGSEGYANDALDMSAQLEALQSKDPDVLVINAYGAPLGYILKGVERLGWDVPMVGELSVAATGLVSTPAPDGLVGSPAAENLKFLVFKSTEYNADDDKVNTMVDTMAAQGSIETTLINAFNYDAPFLIAAAAKKTGNTDPEELAAALEDPSVLADAETAVVPEYAFTADSHATTFPPSAMAIVAPSLLVNGQYGNPDAKK